MKKQFIVIILIGNIVTQDQEFSENTGDIYMYLYVNLYTVMLTGTPK
jgi:hypothetical protein